MKIVVKTLKKNIFYESRGIEQGGWYLNLYNGFQIIIFDKFKSF